MGRELPRNRAASPRCSRQRRAYVHHEFKAGKNLSPMTLPHGSEIVVQMAKDSELSLGDPVTVVVTGEDAGTASHNGDIKTNFYVTDVNGDLAKIMRNEVTPAVATGE